MKNVLLILVITSFLVGDKGIVTPEPQLVSIPSSAQVREVEPVVDRSVVIGEVVVTSCIDMNDDGECDQNESGATHSIVASTDI